MKLVLENFLLKLFKILKNLTKDWFQRSDMSDFFGKALLAFTEADCAMFPAGILLTDLNKGRSDRRKFA